MKAHKKYAIYYACLVAYSILCTQCSQCRNTSGEIITLALQDQQRQPKPDEKRKIDPDKQKEFNQLITSKGPVDIQKVKTLLEEHHVDPTQTYSKGRNVLHYAFLKGDLQLAQCLIDILRRNYPNKLRRLLNQISIKQVSDKQILEETPFICAFNHLPFIKPDSDTSGTASNAEHAEKEVINAQKNLERLNMFKQLITLGTVPRQSVTTAAIIKTLDNDDLDLFHCLLDLPNISQVPPSDYLSILKKVITEGKSEKYIDYLIEKLDEEFLRYIGCSIDVPDNEEGNTLLHEAALGTDKKVNDGVIGHLVPILKNNNSTLNKLNREGKSALHIAIQKGAHKNFEALCKAGADITLPDATGKTPLQMAEEAFKALTQENNSVKKILLKLRN